MEALRPLAPGLLVAATGAFVLAAVRATSRARILAPLGLAVAAIVYRTAFPGLVLLHAGVFLAARRLACMPGDGPVAGGKRWGLARMAMMVLAAAALAGRAAGVTAWRLPVAGMEWAPLYLDMMMFMRLEALLWEVGSGRVSRVDADGFLSWASLPFALFGPLLRFSEWQTQMEVRPNGLRADDLRRSARLLALGAAQLVTVVALVGARAAVAPPPGVEPHLWLKIADGFGFSPWGFYLAAGGYSNLVIASAGLVGIRLPKVFDRPFGRPNLSAFWANWNIPVTSFVRDVIFYQRWGLGRADVYASTMGLFLLIGLWHAGHIYWILWGLVHGLGFCTYITYARQLRAGGRVARLVEAIVPGRVVTYLFVCGAWLLPPQIIRLASLV
jgi:hypothetical protein